MFCELLMDEFEFSMDPGLRGGIFSVFIGLSRVFRVLPGHPAVSCLLPGEGESGGGDVLSVLSLFRQRDMWLVRSALW